MISEIAYHKNKKRGYKGDDFVLKQVNFYPN